MATAYNLKRVISLRVNSNRLVVNRRETVGRLYGNWERAVSAAPHRNCTALCGFHTVAARRSYSGYAIIVYFGAFGTKYVQFLIKITH